MKRLTYLSLLFLCLNLSAQNDTILSGKIIDESNGTPISFAHISLLYPNTGTVANPNGEYSLNCSSLPSSDSISISAIGYKTIALTVSELKANNTIALQPEIYVSELVSVYGNKKNLKAKTFARKLVKDYNKQRLPNSFLMKGYYIETVKKQEQYIKHLESEGYAVLAQRQSGAAPLSAYNYAHTNTRYAVDDELYNSIVDKKHKLLSYGSSNMNSFGRLEKWSVLSKRKWNKYKFKIDSAYLSNGNNYVRISFEEENKQNRSTPHKYSIQKGYIIANKDNYQIRSISLYTNNLWSNIFNKSVGGFIKTEFIYNNDIPLISSITQSYSINNLEHNSTLYILKPKYVPIELTKEDYWMINALSVQPLLKYNADEWSSPNLVKPAVIEQLRRDFGGNEISYEAYFNNNPVENSFVKRYETELLELIQNLNSTCTNYQ